MTRLSGPWRDIRGRSGLAPIALTLVVLLAAALSPGAARAHAEVERSHPVAGSEIPVAPAAVEVWFTEEVVPSLTTLQVIAPDGAQADQGDSAVDLDDLSRRHVTVSLQPELGPGLYTVRWHAVTADDQGVSEGTFTFAIASREGLTAATPGTPCPIPSTPAADATPSPSQMATPRGTPDMGMAAGTPTAQPGPPRSC